MPNKPLETDFEDYTAVAELRFHNLNNLSKIVGRLMNKGCVNVECQTDDISLAEDGKSPKSSIGGVDEDQNI